MLCKTNFCKCSGRHPNAILLAFWRSITYVHEATPINFWVDSSSHLDCTGHSAKTAMLSSHWHMRLAAATPQRSRRNTRSLVNLERLGCHYNHETIVPIGDKAKNSTPTTYPMIGALIYIFLPEIPWLATRAVISKPLHTRMTSS